MEVIRTFGSTLFIPFMNKSLTTQYDLSSSLSNLAFGQAEVAGLAPAGATKRCRFELPTLPLLHELLAVSSMSASDFPSLTFLLLHLLPLSISLQLSASILISISIFGASPQEASTPS
uniref:Uncharacterized protein n=1 Tax=Opuntia streptacantha TaxID=393608 RepID=A0A7C9EMK6_OPUST